MDIDKKEFGERVRQIRMNIGYSQTKFGELFENEELGENKANKGIVSAWERGDSVPSPYRLKVIADLANVSVDELIHGPIRHRVKKYIISHYRSLGVEKTDEEINKLVNTVFEDYRMFYSKNEEPMFSTLQNYMDNVLLFDDDLPMIEYSDEELDSMKPTLKEKLYLSKIHLEGLIKALESTEELITNKTDLIKQIQNSLSWIEKVIEDHNYTY